MPPLTILQLGNFRHYFCSESHWKASLEEMGHRVVAAQENDADWRAIPDLAKAEGASLVMWTKTWEFDADAQQDMIDGMRRVGIPIISYHLDRYLGLTREEQVTRLPWWRTDRVFTPERSSRWAELGVEHRWMPPGVYGTEAALPPRRTSRYETPVVFVGSTSYHPEWAWRQDLLAFLHEHYRRRFQTWPRNGAIRGQALNDLYASAKVVVGDSCLVPPSQGYWSDRLTETLGRGGFLLHPWTPGIDELFVDGLHLRYFEIGDRAGLKALIDYYLDHDDERRKIAKAGQEYVLAEHTYVNRMQQMLDTLRTEGLL